MKKQKHTPGPWVHDHELEHGVPGLVVTLSNRIQIAHMHDWPQAIANANLIAAAPEMLQLIASFVEDDYEWSADNCDAFADCCRALIKKAGTQ